MNTVKLTSGRTVLAKFSDGRLCAKTYANRTQAERAAAQVGGAVIRGLGRPFYVAVPLAMEGACLICHVPADFHFWCPCDLHHALCPTHITIERKDCAWAHLYREGHDG